MIIWKVQCSGADLSTFSLLSSSGEEAPKIVQLHFMQKSNAEAKMRNNLSKNLKFTNVSYL